MQRIIPFIFSFTMLTIGLNAQTNDYSNIRIGLVADIQYADIPTAGSRHYRTGLDKLPVMVEIMNRSQLDMVVDLGDRIDRDFDSFAAVDSLLQQLNAPLIFVPGNHDFSIADKYKKQIIKRTGSPAGYHSRSMGQWRLLFLNGLDNSLVAHPEWSCKYHKAQKKLKKLKAENRANAYDWNGGFNIRQVKWINKEMSKAAKNNQNIIFFCHQPLAPGEIHSLWDAQIILDRLKEFPNQVYWINGHNHAGGYEQIGKVHLLTLHGMVEGENPSFAILEIENNKVSFKAFGDQPGIRFLSGRGK